MVTKWAKKLHIGVLDIFHLILLSLNGTNAALGKNE